jgi:hypothetical protein
LKKSAAAKATKVTKVVKVVKRKHDAGLGKKAAAAATSRGPGRPPRLPQPAPGRPLPTGTGKMKTRPPNRETPAARESSKDVPQQGKASSNRDRLVEVCKALDLDAKLVPWGFPKDGFAADAIENGDTKQHRKAMQVYHLLTEHVCKLLCPEDPALPRSLAAARAEDSPAPAQNQRAEKRSLDTCNERNPSKRPKAAAHGDTPLVLVPDGAQSSLAPLVIAPGSEFVVGKQEVSLQKSPSTDMLSLEHLFVSASSDGIVTVEARGAKPLSIGMNNGQPAVLHKNVSSVLPVGATLSLVNGLDMRYTLKAGYSALARACAEEPYRPAHFLAKQLEVCQEEVSQLRSRLECQVAATALEMLRGDTATVHAAGVRMMKDAKRRANEEISQAIEKWRNGVSALEAALDMGADTNLQLVPLPSEGTVQTWRALLERQKVLVREEGERYVKITTNQADRIDLLESHLNAAMTAESPSDGMGTFTFDIQTWPKGMHFAVSPISTSASTEMEPDTEDCVKMEPATAEDCVPQLLVLEPQQQQAAEVEGKEGAGIMATAEGCVQVPVGPQPPALTMGNVLCVN